MTTRRPVSMKGAESAQKALHWRAGRSKEKDEIWFKYPNLRLYFQQWKWRDMWTKNKPGWGPASSWLTCLCLIWKWYLSVSMYHTPARLEQYLSNIWDESIILQLHQVPVSSQVNGVRESSMILFFRKIAHSTLYLNEAAHLQQPAKGVLLRVYYKKFHFEIFTFSSNDYETW